MAAYSLRRIVRVAACFVITALILAVTGCGQETEKEETVPENIPEEYKQLYLQLWNKLGEFDEYLTSGRNISEDKVTFAAELLTANAHMGERLLTEEQFQANLVYLDGLQSLGVQGVKVTIAYPFLSKDFPNQERYLEFYKRIIQESRRRNMVVLVSIGNLLAGSQFSNVQYSFAGLTMDKYRETKREMVGTIIRELHPDYLTIAVEPQTEAMAIGLRQSPSSFTETVQYILEGLDRSGVDIGAGPGSWDDLEYVRKLAQDTTLDYIDVHIYPAKYLEQAVTMATIAQAANKRLIIGEMWTYKVDESGLAGIGNVAAQAEIFGRDVYSFWQPLDSKFLELVARMARVYKYEFISPFWSTYLFGYLDYEEVPASISYSTLRHRSNLRAWDNLLHNQVSETGLAYKKIISSTVSSR